MCLDGYDAEGSLRDLRERRFRDECAESITLERLACWLGMTSSSDSTARWPRRILVRKIDEDVIEKKQLFIVKIIENEELLLIKS